MSRALLMLPSGRWRVHSATGVVAAVTSAALLSGCTAEPAAEAPPTTAPVTSPTTAASASPGTPPEPVQIEFEFRRPDPSCPPVSALETLPLADQRPYELVNSHSSSDVEVERFGHFAELCPYQRAEIGEGDEDMLLEDHARISAQVHLYRRWEDSVHAGPRSSYHALPVLSADLDDWQVARRFDSERVWWEDCGEQTPCAEGEEPTVETRAWQVEFAGHVGNLEFFNVRISYIAQRLPADVELRTIEIFRDFVLAAMESYERAG